MCRGLDGTECEDFIFAIRQRALIEGKMDENKWALTIASAGFAREALRWYITLDSSIQNDWLLLQKALLARFRPVFRGIDGIECEEFVSNVRRRALDEGKDEDNEVGFAAVVVMCGFPEPTLICFIVDTEDCIRISRRRCPSMACDTG